MSTGRLVGLVVLTGMALVATACRSEPTQGAPGIGDPYYPNLGNGGYDVGHYWIEMDVDPKTGEVNAVTTIDARATSALTSFNLDFQGLEIDAVTVNGQPASHTRDGSELRIEPAQPLRKGANFETRVVYHGKPGPVQSESGPYEVGWFQAPSGAVNMISEPDGASTWFPVNDHPLDKATYRFEITVPDPWIVAATGKLVQTVAENGRTRFISEMDRPMASCLAAIQIDQYEIERHAGPDGVIIRNYIPKKTYSALTRDLLLLPEMLEFYTARFGPYPYQEYGVVIAREIISLCQGWGSAEENQTLSIHCPNMMSEPVLAHELAHQWFGDSVSLERWEDLWLKEGLATYAEWLWTERNAAPDEFSDFIQAWRDEVAMEMTSPIGHPPADNLYTMEAYVGGALLLDDLRTRMGDEAFFRLLQHYAWKYRDGNAGVEDFIAAAERVSGQDLQAFFDSWLLDTELPPSPPA